MVAWKSCLFPVQPLSSFLEGSLLLSCMHRMGGVQEEEQAVHFKLLSAVLSSPQLSTMHAEGKIYSHTHTHTRDGQAHVMVIVLVNRDCRAFAPVGEIVASPKRRSQGHGLSSILP